jgi:multiple sugar transport system permease protein
VISAPIAARRRSETETRRPGWRSRHLKPIALLVPAVGIIAFTVFFPLVYTSAVAFYQYNPVSDVPPRPVGMQNFVDVITNPASQEVFLRTAGFTIVVVALEFLVGFGLALLVVDRVRRGAGFFRAVLLLPMAMTPVAAGLMWRWLLDYDRGLVNYGLRLLGIGPVAWLGDPHWAIVSIAIADLWQWTPFVFLMMLAGLAALPKEPIESATVDGAGWFALLWHITLPMLRGIVTLVLVIRSVDVLKLFDTIFVMTEGGPGTSTELLSYTIYKTAFRYFDAGHGAAMSWIMLLVVVLLSSRVLSRLTREEFGER